MNTMTPTQWTALKWQALLVLFICYIPHITTQPLWLFILLITVVAYRFLADYYHYAPIRWWISLPIVIGLLVVLSINMFSTGFFVRLILTFILLKCVELNTVRDIKANILCNFLLIFTALIVTHELWIIIYMFMATFANLILILKLNAPGVPIGQISSKSSQQLLIIIPLCLILFYIFPRIDPLWLFSARVNSPKSLEETMTPGSISELFQDDSVVMQITFAKNPNWRGYWRGIFLIYYNGKTWYPALLRYSDFQPLNLLKADEAADYEILLEPSINKWLFYEGYPMASKPDLSFSANHGLIPENKTPISRRFNYSLKIIKQPYQALSSKEYSAATQLPVNSDPRLTVWAKQQFANVHYDVNNFISFLQKYIHDQSFWYTLTPPSLGDTNQMDTFWFETQRGFCEYYAGAVTVILRAAGIPARVLLGYHGGQWNPITNSLTLYQYNAHAWVEYWQEGVGWQQLDPTASIAVHRTDYNIQIRQNAFANQGEYYTMSATPWRQRIKLVIDSVRFYSERWILLYNQNTQQHLLESLGLGTWNTGQLLQISVGSIPIIFLLLALYYKWRLRKSLDPLLHEYHLLQDEFRRFNVPVHPSRTLKQQCHLLHTTLPTLAPLLGSFMDRYEELRLKKSTSKAEKNKSQTIDLFKKLRYALKRSRSNFARF